MMAGLLSPTWSSPNARIRRDGFFPHFTVFSLHSLTGLGKNPANFIRDQHLLTELI